MILDQPPKSHWQFDWKRHCTPLVLVSIFLSVLSFYLGVRALKNTGFDPYGLEFLVTVITLGFAIIALGVDRLLVYGFRPLYVWGIEIGILLVICAGILW